MRWYKIFFLLILLTLSLQAAEKKTVCLNMIVKNESKVIERCLESVKPLIDSWVIVDTGSTDGTQEVIRKYMKGIPGKLYQRAWVNFEHNRNEALQLAKDRSDYLLFIDADEELKFSKDFVKPVFDKNYYYIQTKYGGTEYNRVQLTSTRLDWKWEGVVHEVLVAPNIQTGDTLKGVYNLVRREGCRSQDPECFLKDAKLLEEDLKKNPNNTRSVFYLAQSYRDAGDHKSALKYYLKRVEMGGFAEEVFISKYNIALIREALGEAQDLIVKSYLDAYQYRPQRVEPLCRLAKYLRIKGDNALAYIISSHALALPRTEDILFVESWIYDYGLLIEQAVAAWWIGKYDETLKNSLTLLEKDLPDHIKEYVEKDLIKWALEKMVTIEVSRKLP